MKCFCAVTNSPSTEVNILRCSQCSSGFHEACVAKAFCLASVGTNSFLCFMCKIGALSYFHKTVEILNKPKLLQNLGNSSILWLKHKMPYIGYSKMGSQLKNPSDQSSSRPRMLVSLFCLPNILGNYPKKSTSGPTPPETDCGHREHSHSPKILGQSQSQASFSLKIQGAFGCHTAKSYGASTLSTANAVTSWSDIDSSSNNSPSFLPADTCYDRRLSVSLECDTKVNCWLVLALQLEMPRLQVYKCLISMLLLKNRVAVERRKNRQIKQHNSDANQHGQSQTLTAQTESVALKKLVDFVNRSGQFIVFSKRKKPKHIVAAFKSKLFQSAQLMHLIIFELIPGFSAKLARIKSRHRTFLRAIQSSAPLASRQQPPKEFYVGITELLDYLLAFLRRGLVDIGSLTRAGSDGLISQPFWCSICRSKSASDLETLLSEGALKCAACDRALGLRHVELKPRVMLVLRKMAATDAKIVSAINRNVDAGRYQNAEMPVDLAKATTQETSIKSPLDSDSMRSKPQRSKQPANQNASELGDSLKELIDFVSKRVYAKPQLVRKMKTLDLAEFFEILYKIKQAVAKSTTQALLSFYIDFDVIGINDKIILAFKLKYLAKGADFDKSDFVKTGKKCQIEQQKRGSEKNRSNEIEAQPVEYTNARLNNQRSIRGMKGRYKNFLKNDKNKNKGRFFKKRIGINRCYDYRSSGKSIKNTNLDKNSKQVGYRFNSKRNQRRKMNQFYYSADSRSKNKNPSTKIRPKYKRKLRKTSQKKSRCKPVYSDNKLWSTIQGGEFRRSIKSVEHGPGKREKQRSRWPARQTRSKRVLLFSPKERSEISNSNRARTQLFPKSKAMFATPTQLESQNTLHTCAQSVKLKSSETRNWKFGRQSRVFDKMSKNEKHSRHGSYLSKPWWKRKQKQILRPQQYSNKVKSNSTRKYSSQYHPNQSEFSMTNQTKKEKFYASKNTDWKFSAQRRCSLEKQYADDFPHGKLKFRLVRTKTQNKPDSVSFQHPSRTHCAGSEITAKPQPSRARPVARDKHQRNTHKQSIPESVFAETSEKHWDAEPEIICSWLSRPATRDLSFYEICELVFDKTKFSDLKEFGFASFAGFSARVRSISSNGPTIKGSVFVESCLVASKRLADQAIPPAKLRSLLVKQSEPNSQSKYLAMQCFLAFCCGHLFQSVIDTARFFGDWVKSPERQRRVDCARVQRFVWRLTAYFVSLMAPSSALDRDSMCVFLYLFKSFFEGLRVETSKKISLWLFSKPKRSFRRFLKKHWKKYREVVKAEADTLSRAELANTVSPEWGNNLKQTILRNEVAARKFIKAFLSKAHVDCELLI